LRAIAVIAVRLGALALAASTWMGCAVARAPGEQTASSDAMRVEAVVREFHGFSGEDLYADGHSQVFAQVDLEILHPASLAGRLLKIHHTLPVPSASPLRVPGMRVHFLLSPTMLDRGIELYEGALQGLHVEPQREVGR
jgi:hypothetical protein